MASKTNRLDQGRDALRLRHVRVRTEAAYLGWIRRFPLFHPNRHPNDMGAEAVRAFLSHLAVAAQVAASPQQVALHALRFLSRHVLHQPWPAIGPIAHAQRPRRLPPVLTHEEATAVLAQWHGTSPLMTSLLYGAGLRRMACLRLRVKARDCAYCPIVVRDGQGAQDRVTMLPQALGAPVQRHLITVQALHEEEGAEGYGDVYLP